MCTEFFFLLFPKYNIQLKTLYLGALCYHRDYKGDLKYMGGSAVAPGK